MHKEKLDMDQEDIELLNEQEMKFQIYDEEPLTNQEREELIKRFWVRHKKRQKLESQLEIIIKPILKILKYAIALAVLLGTAILLSGIPRKVSWSGEGYILSIENTSYPEDNIKIAVDGKLYKRWFTRPKFKGNISFSNLEYTKTYNLSDIIFYKLRNGNMHGSLTWYYFSGGKRGIVSESLGSIFTDSNMTSFVVWLYEALDERESNSTDQFFLVTARNREDAKEIFYKIVPVEYGWENIFQ